MFENATNSVEQAAALGCAALASERDRSLIAFIAGTLTIMDFFKFKSISADNYPVFTVFLLSMVALHLIVTHLSNVDFQEKTNKALISINSGSNATEYIQYQDSASIESALAKRILESRISVCDLSWKAKLSEGFSAKDRQVTHTYMDKCIAEASDRITYREIFTFGDKRRIEKLERRIDENKSGYSCRYFNESIEIPRLQFVLVDSEHVFFFASSADSVLCSFRSKELAKVLLSYYEAAWNNAIPIKEGPNIIQKSLEEVRTLINS